MQAVVPFPPRRWVIQGSLSPRMLLVAWQASNQSFKQPIRVARLTIDKRISLRLPVCIVICPGILQQFFLMEYTASTVGSVVREILFLSQIVEVPRESSARHGESGVKDWNFHL
jgi:hypothetical protein